MIAFAGIVFGLTHFSDQGRPVVALLAPAEIEGEEIPCGFTTDWASIPQPLWVLFPVFGRSARAALRHDWDCYEEKGRGERSRTFLDIMRKDGVPTWQAMIQYLIVRWWPGPETVHLYAALQPVAPTVA